MTLVGVGKFVGEGDNSSLVLHRSDAQAVERQIQRTREVEASRGGEKVQKTLDDLCRAAEPSGNSGSH